MSSCQWAIEALRRSSPSHRHAVAHLCQLCPTPPQVFSATGTLVAAEYKAYIYGYSCTQDWNISSPYYPCVAGSSVNTEQVTMVNGAYNFNGLKLVGYHNMSYNIRFYVSSSTRATSTIADVYSSVSSLPVVLWSWESHTRTHIHPNILLHP